LPQNKAKVSWPVQYSHHQSVSAIPVYLCHFTHQWIEQRTFAQYSVFP